MFISTNSARSITICDTLISVRAMASRFDRPAPIGAEAAVQPGARHQIPRQLHVQRRQCIGDIVDHIRFGATLAEKDHRAKPSPGAHPNHQFIRTMPELHRLHRKTVNRGFRRQRTAPA
jgi:hypothetical protein